MGVVSLVFHLALFLVPLLLPAHNILFFQTFRVSLPTLPEPLMDVLTLGLLAIGAFFLRAEDRLPPGARPDHGARLSHPPPGGRAVRHRRTWPTTSGWTTARCW